VALLRNLMLKGGDPGVAAWNLAALAAMAVSMAGVAFVRFKRTLD
jgi:hypothetical protein